MMEKAKEKEKISLGNKLRYLRRKNKLTQKEISDKIGKTTASITMWENGKQAPGFFTLCTYADIFDVSVNIFDPNTPLNITL